MRVEFYGCAEGEWVIIFLRGLKVEHLYYGIDQMCTIYFGTMPAMYFGTIFSY